MQRRPGFPARLDGAGGAASKPAPAPLRPTVRPNVPAAPHGVGLDSAAVRARMVQKLAAGGIASPLVLQALSSVERHRFVDSALVNQAYEDTSLPIGLAQTISKPSVVARMCELLLGAECARTGGLGRVLEKARDNLRHLRLANVHLLFGDGMQGYAKGAPYAAIIAAAGGEAVPQAWCDQLALGGRLVAPMALAGGQQVLLVIDKTAHGLKQSVLEPVHFVPLKSGIA